MRALSYIVAFTTALLLGMFVISTWLEAGLIVALFSLGAVGATFGTPPRQPRAGKSRYGNYESTVHLGKATPRKADRYDIFSDK